MNSLNIHQKINFKSHISSKERRQKRVSAEYYHDLYSLPWSMYTDLSIDRPLYDEHVANYPFYTLGAIMNESQRKIDYRYNDMGELEHPYLIDNDINCFHGNRFK